MTKSMRKPHRTRTDRNSPEARYCITQGIVFIAALASLICLSQVASASQCAATATAHYEQLPRTQTLNIGFSHDNDCPSQFCGGIIHYTVHYHCAANGQTRSFNWYSDWDVKVKDWGSRYVDLYGCIQWDNVPIVDSVEITDVTCHAGEP
jgi:hypothetical protein